MNEKFRILTILLLIAIILGVIFISCEKKDTSDYNKYRQAFIKANINFGCQIKNAPQTLENPDTTKQILTEAYKTFNLPVENNTEMKNILTYFQNDLEAINEIAVATQNCK